MSKKETKEKIYIQPLTYETCYECVIDSDENLILKEDIDGHKKGSRILAFNFIEIDHNEKSNMTSSLKKKKMATI